WLSDTYLIFHVVSQVRERVTLLQAALGSDCLVTTGKRNRLKRKKGNLLRIVQSKSNNRSDLVVVNSVDQRRNQNNFDACFVKIVNSPQLHVEEVPYLAMTVGVVSYSIKLEVDVPQAGLGRFVAEFFTFGELNPVCGRLHRVVAHFS